MRQQTADDIRDELERVDVDAAKMTTILQITAHAQVRTRGWGGVGSEGMAVCVHCVTLGAPWMEAHGTLNLHSGYVQAGRRRGGSRHRADDCDTGEADQGRLQHVEHVERV